LGLLLGVSERVSDSRKHFDVVMAASVARKSAFDIGVIGLRVCQFAVPGEDRVGGSRSEFAAFGGFAGLKDDRISLRTLGPAESSQNLELWPHVTEFGLGALCGIP